MKELMKKNNLIAIIALVFVIIIISGIHSSAISQGVNVSYNCDVTQVSTGDEVRLVVSTKEMSICTFIAYVEYDSSLLEYQGFVGGVSGKEEAAYLTTVEDRKDKYHEVAVEQGDSGDVIGMYMVGVDEVRYSAAEPLVTLIFKAKNAGTIEEKSFVTAESTDGTDGYTSESIIEENKALTESSANSTTSTGLIKTNFTLLIVLIVVLISGIIIATIIIKRRRK